MTIEADTKDWTWVLERRCPECGFDAGAVDLEQMGDRIRALAVEWEAALAGAGAARRSRPDLWSVLEYGCHVRDVFRIFDERLRRMVAEDDPRYENWDQDRTAVEDRYADQDPATVANELAEAGDAIAARFDAVTPEQWDRPGRRSDGARFTIDSFARYFLHDPVHHLHDVGGGA